MKITLSGVGKVADLKQSVEKFKIRHPKGNIFIIFSDFENEIEMNKFRMLFPKYVKIKESNNQYGKILTVEILALNNKTGIKNEIGEKRLNKIIEVLNKI